MHLKATLGESGCQQESELTPSSQVGGHLSLGSRQGVQIAGSPYHVWVGVCTFVCAHKSLIHVCKCVCARGSRSLIRVIPGPTEVKRRVPGGYSRGSLLCH